MQDDRSLSFDRLKVFYDLALLSLCVIAGTWIGSQLLESVSETGFTRLYKAVLTLIAIRLVVWEGLAWIGVR